MIAMMGSHTMTLSYDVQMKPSQQQWYGIPETGQVAAAFRKQ